MLNMLTCLILEQYRFELCKVIYLRIFSNTYVEKFLKVCDNLKELVDEPRSMKYLKN